MTTTTGTTIATSIPAINFPHSHFPALLSNPMEGFPSNSHENTSKSFHKVLIDWIAILLTSTQMSSYWPRVFKSLHISIPWIKKWNRRLVCIYVSVFCLGAPTLSLISPLLPVYAAQWPRPHRVYMAGCDSVLGIVAWPQLPGLLLPGVAERRVKYRAVGNNWHKQ